MMMHVNCLQVLILFNFATFGTCQVEKVVKDLILTKSEFETIQKCHVVTFGIGSKLTQYLVSTSAASIYTLEEPEREETLITMKKNRF